MSQREQQPYDRALKSLMEDHANEIIPQLLPGAEVISEKNVELKREILRPDLVYLMRTTMLSAEEKQTVIDQLYTYNSLYDEDPEIQEGLARKAVIA